MNNSLFQRKWYTVINKRTFDQLPWNTPLKMLVNFNQKMCKTGKGEDVVFIESAWKRKLQSIVGNFIINYPSWLIVHKSIYPSTMAYYWSKCVQSWPSPNYSFMVANKCFTMTISLHCIDDQIAIPHFPWWKVYIQT